MHLGSDIPDSAGVHFTYAWSATLDGQTFTPPTGTLTSLPTFDFKLSDAEMAEMALVAEGPRTATATLTEPAHLFVLAHREFHSLMHDIPEVRDCVLNGVARRIRELEPDRA